MSDLRLIRCTLDEIIHAGPRYVNKETARRVAAARKQVKELNDEVIGMEEQFPGYAEEANAQIDLLFHLIEQIEDWLVAKGYELEND